MKPSDQSKDHAPDVEQEQDENVDEVMTVHEVALYLRVDDTTVRRWIKGGALEAIELPHIGKRTGYRIKRSTFDGLFNN